MIGDRAGRYPEEEIPSRFQLHTLEHYAVQHFRYDYSDDVQEIYSVILVFRSSNIVFFSSMI